MSFFIRFNHLLEKKVTHSIIDMKAFFVNISKNDAILQSDRIHFEMDIVRLRKLAKNLLECLRPYVWLVSLFTSK